MKKKGIVGFFSAIRRNGVIRPVQATATVPSVLAAMPAPTLLGMPRDIHYLLSDQLGFAEWGALQRSCKALRAMYQREDMWRRRAANMLLLPEFVFDHPEFSLFNFDYRQLIQIFVRGGEGLKKVLRVGIEPWQLAALSGKLPALKAAYPGDTILELLDENTFGVEDYLVMGGHREALVHWGEMYSPGFDASKDKTSKFPRLAVIMGDIPFLQFLVEHYGYDVTFYNPVIGKNLLEIAVEYGQRKMAAWLISQGVSQTQGTNLYKVAAKDGHWGIFEDIRRLGVLKLNQRMAHACLRYVALKGNAELYKQLCSEFKLGERLRTYRPHELGPFLNDALIGGSLEIIEDILSKGIISIDSDLDGTRYPGLDPRFDYGKNALHVLAQHGHLDLIQILLIKFPHKLCAQAVDENGNTLLHYSAARGVLKETHLLCDRYFKPEDFFAPNKKGETIVHLAAAHGRLNYLHLLRMECGRKNGQEHADDLLRVLDAAGNSALHHACNKGFSTLAVWLIDTVKLSPNAKNNNGDIPLHYFAFCLHMKQLNWHTFERVAKRADYKMLTESINKQGRTVASLLRASDNEANLEALAPKSSKFQVFK